MTAQDHRDAAAQLLADVNDAADNPGAARVLTQAAIAHALLGLLEIQIDRAAHDPQIINNHVTKGN